MDGSHGFPSYNSSDAKQKHAVANENLESTVFWLRNVAITYGLLSVGCTVCGVLTLSYSSPSLHWPFSSASGVWTGCMAFATFLIGLRAFKNYDIRDPAASKCPVIAFYTLVIICITLGLLHLVYSSIGYTYCVQDYVKDNKYQCFTDETARITLTEGFNMAFGSILCLLSIATTVYMATGRRLRTLTGVTTQYNPVVYGTCCGGNCVCYSDA